MSTGKTGRDLAGWRVNSTYDEKARYVGRLLSVLDTLLTALVFVSAYWARELLFPENPTDYYRHLAVLPLLLAVQVLVLYRAGAYRGLRAVGIGAYGKMLLKALAVGFLVLFAVLYMLKVQFVSRGFLLIFAVADLGALTFVRGVLVWWYFRQAKERGENYHKVLVVGTGRRAKRLADTLKEHSEWGIDVVGYLDVGNAEGSAAVPRSQVLGSVAEIGSVLKNQVVDEVIVAMPRSMIKDVQNIADACEEEGVKLRLMADVFDLEVSRLRLVDLGGIPLLTFEPVAQDEKKLLIKRIMDLVLVLASAPIVAPLMMFVALAIKLDSPGPVLFVQQRVGLRKRVFPMCKFRSMHQDAEQRLSEIEHLNEAEGPIFKIADDPRVTRVGKFIRRTSLDELPQLLNVLRGHMSLVGPRPMSLRDVGLFDRGIQRKRFSVRPGLTCLWQVSGRSNLPFAKWLELDLHYIDNWSLWLDMRILIKTVPTVLRGSGAV